MTAVMNAMDSKTLAALVIEASLHLDMTWQELAAKVTEWITDKGEAVDVSESELASLAACMKFTGTTTPAPADLLKDMLTDFGVLKAPPVDHGTKIPVEVDGCKGMLVMRPASELFNTFLHVPLPVIEWEDAIPSSVPRLSPHFKVTPALDHALLSMSLGVRTWLYGHTGTGKTHTVKEVCARCALPLTRINFDSEMTRADLVGKTELLNDNGTTISRFVDGVLPKAIPHPGVLLLDELDFIRPDLAYVMQAVLEGDELVLTGDNGRRVKVHPQCWIVAAANTVGQGDDVGMYRGAREQSAAFLNRFQCFIQFEYMDVDMEVDHLVASTGLPRGMAEVLVTYLYEHRQAFGRREVMTPVSLRQGLAVATRVMYLNQYGKEPIETNMAKAVESVIFNALPEHERIKMAGILQRITKG